jgi:hypothetical protein
MVKLELKLKQFKTEGYMYLADRKASAFKQRMLVGQ